MTDRGEGFALRVARTDLVRAAARRLTSQADSLPRSSAYVLVIRITARAGIHAPSSGTGTRAPLDTI
ncbi:hypothetical protein GCM10010320_02350 [Streptomyces caelestis]|nr:hypothetical protein GCM10010320_02350 [Streptomyces caelestis]